MALRLKRDPNQAMFITGYYNQPMSNEVPNNFNYEHRMNPENCRSCGGDIIRPLEEVQNVEVVTEEKLPLPLESVTEHNETPSKLEEQPSQKEIKKPVKKQPKETSEEDDDELSFFKPQFRGQQPVMFFPIMFGGGSLGRSGAAPNGPTAIANSFSTGKKGVATSTATAYGDPASFLRNGKIDLRYGTQ